MGAQDEGKVPVKKDTAGSAGQQSGEPLVFKLEEPAAPSPPTEEPLEFALDPVPDDKENFIPEPASDFSFADSPSAPRPEKKEEPAPVFSEPSAVPLGAQPAVSGGRDVPAPEAKPVAKAHMPGPQGKRIEKKPGPHNVQAKAEPVREQHIPPKDAASNRQKRSGFPTRAALIAGGAVLAAGSCIAVFLLLRPAQEVKTVEKPVVPVKKIHAQPPAAEQQAASTKQAQEPVQALIKKPETVRPAEPVKKPTPPAMAVYEDTNAYFFLNIPGGFTIRDQSAGTKTNVDFDYGSGAVRMNIAVHPLQSSSDIEKEMYTVIVDVQQGRGAFAGMNVASYSPGKLSGEKSYEIMLSGQGEAEARRLCFLAVNSYGKHASIVICCDNIREDQSKGLFDSLRNAVTKSFLIYPN